jgi:tRNA1Val (adenine37-N6)-methyltransferase
MENSCLREGETLDVLTPQWKIFQLRSGHRFSVDDMVVAWRASRSLPHARTLLDLGCGVGSVGLATLDRMKNAESTLIGIEAQEMSAGLFQRSIEYNNLGTRVQVIRSDLRNRAIISGAASFDLITGSPPYFPLGTGLPSPVEQRARARFEYLGSIVDYCEAARHWLAPKGRFYFVMPTDDKRTENAICQSGLSVCEQWDVVFREGVAPRVTVWGCRRMEEEGEYPVNHGVLVIRSAGGEFTSGYTSFRKQMGMDDPRSRSIVDLEEVEQTEKEYADISGH